MNDVNKDLYDCTNRLNDDVIKFNLDWKIINQIWIFKWLSQEIWIIKRRIERRSWKRRINWVDCKIYNKRINMKV